MLVSMHRDAVYDRTDSRAAVRLWCFVPEALVLAAILTKLLRPEPLEQNVDILRIIMKAVRPCPYG